MTHHQGHLPFSANECGCVPNLQLSAAYCFLIMEKKKK